MKDIKIKSDEMVKMKKWALIGASPDESKFGYKILMLLKKKGYTVYGINPKYDEINGTKIYNSLKDLPETVDAVSIIVNPNVALRALDEIIDFGIDNVWFQPGSYNQEVLDKAKNNELNIVFHECLYVELGKI
ncbi:CoA-binding protein [Clostridium tagluense]|uniref:CoA-binding protein n=1 Tax=Clostridium tagluense TaxID=360422 RepID=UPI001C0C8C72|nr:CoA-binding protein [Clostridium tagluense]MBU3127303.1 CoA-binding protein [Clostridium tagluense]MCB2311223.1 CoA-binding protein [Clostridium tagluense]MCB2315947.1 CoA-binding protein [Clostridium tagluense]MCB2320706.1 CoA-binding protein [Clostridium tagluense]MCB2325723.1 CoA-binding protein [Clostridium tagluense]